MKNVNIFYENNLKKKYKKIQKFYNKIWTLGDSKSETKYWASDQKIRWSQVWDLKPEMVVWDGLTRVRMRYVLNNMLYSNVSTKERDIYFPENLFGPCLFVKS